MKQLTDETVLKLINKRIDEVHKRIDDLAESYKVLNEHHQDTENSLIEMKTEYKTTKSWVKFIFGTSLAGTLVSILTVLRMFGVL